MSVAGGTFIYIAASEVVVEEFAVSNYKWTKFFFFLCGAIPIPFIIWATDKD